MILLVSLTTIKAIDCEVLTTVGKDQKRMIFFPKKVKTSTRSNLCRPFIVLWMMLRYLEHTGGTGILKQYHIQHAFLVVGCTWRFWSAQQWLLQTTLSSEKKKRKKSRWPTSESSNTSGMFCNHQVIYHRSKILMSKHDLWKGKRELGFKEIPYLGNF